jgi:hypothetical protein
LKDCKCQGNSLIALLLATRMRSEAAKRLGALRDRQVYFLPRVQLIRAILQRLQVPQHRSGSGSELPDLARRAQSIIARGTN